MHLVDLDGIEHPPASLALGFFDGVHVGHQAVLAATVEAAQSRRLTPTVLTFADHPRHVLQPGSGPTLLMTFEERVEQLAHQGIERVVAVQFTRDLAALTPRQFIDDWLGSRLNSRYIAVGPNYRFGHRAAGTPAMLHESNLCPVQVVQPVWMDGDIVSSTRIRGAIEAARFDDAARWLSRPWMVHGVVQGGDQRGRTLGAPTANLPLDPLRQYPPHGVYAVWARLDALKLPAVANLGVRPTFDGQTAQLEVHLLDTRLDLYGRRLDVQFVKRLRPEQKFDSPEALQAQIRRDVEEARTALA